MGAWVPHSTFVTTHESTVVHGATFRGIEGNIVGKVGPSTQIVFTGRAPLGEKAGALV